VKGEQKNVTQEVAQAAAKDVAQDVSGAAENGRVK